MGNIFNEDLQNTQHNNTYGNFKKDEVNKMDLLE